ncbi:type II toxin-antitoxin system VapC family toxin [Syntrophomonas palmitatica]|uniref:type II toxin-antitoxin system VapC family toxin n=1 Tax=Syntrophomonas palmitatica TaxID=402877 RepID=UPI000ABA81F1|nr:type II toxin-antitoxin system VapC family toxin [Syntrophomonas palmitatica]
MDTNIIIHLLNGEQQIIEKISSASEVFISSIVVGELYYGAYKSRKQKQNIERLNELVKALPVLPCDTDVALEYGVIKAQLLGKGKPIPENDIWIAAIAKKHNLILVSRDEHMGYLDEIITERWQ